MRGLKYEVQLQMIRDRPENLKELYQLAIDKDEELCQMRRKYGDPIDQPNKKRRLDTHDIPPHAPYNPASGSNGDHHTGIDIYAAWGSNGKLTPAEKARRKKFNLCLYCGESDHWSTTCPVKKGKSAETGHIKPAITPKSGPDHRADF